MHTRWIETEWDNQVPPFTAGEALDEDEALPRQSVVVEVGGRRVEVSLPGQFSLGGGGSAADGAIRRKPKARKRGGAGGGAASGDAVTAPMQGTVVKLLSKKARKSPKAISSPSSKR